MQRIQSRNTRWPGLGLIAILTAALVVIPWQEASATFPKGDVNGDTVVDLADAIALLNFLFTGGPAPAPCKVSGQAGGTADVNKDGLVDIADVIYLLTFLFGGGPAPIPAAGPC